MQPRDLGHSLVRGGGVLAGAQSPDACAHQPYGFAYFCIRQIADLMQFVEVFFYGYNLCIHGRHYVAQVQPVSRLLHN